MVIQFREIRSYLKEKASAIRKTRENLKIYQRENSGYDGGHFAGITELKRDFRHHHIVYSLINGRSYDEIECPAPGNEPDQQYLREIENAWRADKKDVRACA